MTYTKIPTSVMKQLNEDLKENKRFKNNMFAGTAWESLFAPKTLMDVFGEELSKKVSTLLGLEVKKRINNESGHDHYTTELGRIEDKGVRAKGSIINQIRPDNGFDYFRAIVADVTEVKVYQCTTDTLFREIEEGEKVETHRTARGKQNFTVGGMAHFQGWVARYPWIKINNGFAIDTGKLNELSKVAELIAEGDMYWEN